MTLLCSRQLKLNQLVVLTILHIFHYIQVNSTQLNSHRLNSTCHAHVINTVHVSMLMIYNVLNMNHVITANIIIVLL